MRRRPFAHSILTVAAGSAIGSAIGFLVSPALTRLFTPEEFGEFSVTLSIVLILLSLVTGRMELAVALPAEDGQARALLLLGGLTACFTITALAVATLLFPRLFMLVTPESAHGILTAVPVLLVPVASFQLLNSWAIRQSRYKAIASRNVLQSSTMAIVQLGTGLVGYGTLGLLGGYLAGQLVGILALLRHSGLLVRDGCDFATLRSVSRSYRRFPLVLAPTGFVNALGAQVPILIVATTYGAASAGLLALALRVLSVPVTLLGQSTAQVYISELARSHRIDRADELMPLFLRTTKLLTLVGIAVVLVGGPVSYFAFGPVFGASWADAGKLASVLTLGIAAQLVGSSVSQTLIVFRHVWTIVIWDIGRLATTTATLFGSWLMGWSLIEAVSALSVVTTVQYLIYWRMSCRTLALHSPQRISS